MTVEYAKVLKYYREGAGLNPMDLSRQARVDPAQLSRMEGGIMGAGPLKAMQLAEALKVPVTERAAFYLLASGYPKEEVEQIMGNATTHSALKVDSVKTTSQGRRLIIEIEIPS